MIAKLPCSICNEPTAPADQVTIQRVATKDGIYHCFDLGTIPAALADKAFILPANACRNCVDSWKATDPTLPAHLALGAADHGSFLAPAWQDQKGQAPAGYAR